jgi:integrase
VYSKPFFIMESCPHVARLLDGGKSIGQTHVEASRRWLEMWVLPDITFSQRPMREITRGDVLDLRRRLRARVASESRRIQSDGLPTVNKVMAAVKTVFFEAYFREDIPANPADGVGDITYDERGPDILTVIELVHLFGEPGGNLAHRVFRTAAWTGMRCGEILGMQCDQLQGRTLKVDHAFKHHLAKETGLPKWGKIREIALASDIARELEEYTFMRKGLVFCSPEGGRLRTTWWRESFKALLRAGGIDAAGRHITPHSLRHSLNTHLLEAGVDPLRIQLYLWGPRAQAGQESGISKIQRIYTHFQSDMTEPVALAIESLFTGHEASKMASGV